MSTELDAERLRELLHYCQDTGVFTRLVRTSPSVKVGDVAGSNSHGYTQIRVLGKPRLAHRLAWLHVYGVLPEADIDHIDGDPGNNRIANLRDVSRSVNMQNQRRARLGSASGIIGASRHGTRWQALITVDGKPRCIGTFETPELAHAAYIDAKRKLHEGCTL